MQWIFLLDHLLELEETSILDIQGEAWIEIIMEIDWGRGVWDCTWFAFKVKGGKDKQGFLMKNSVFDNYRVIVFLKPRDKNLKLW